MKAVLERISDVQQKSVVFKYIDLPSFDAPFHYHPEIELTYILKGKGIRHVGMKMEEFSEGDFIFLGGNVPHCWLNEASDENVKALVIQFRKETLADGLLNLPEFSSTSRFIDLASKGIKIKNPSYQRQLEEIFELKGASQILGLMNLLVQLEQEEVALILDAGFDSKSQTDRYHKVFSYIIEHFRTNLSLDEVAQVAGLSPTSFCRYFKEITGKSLFEVVLDYRLEASCQLLLGSQKRISDIAFESGFEDIPYFNRSFKKKMGMSPRQFRGEKLLKQRH